MIAAFTAAGRNAAGSALSAGALATGACWGAAWASCCIISLRFAPSRTTATEMLVPGWRVPGAFTSIVWPISARRAIPSLSSAITRASTTCPFRGRLPSSKPRFCSCAIDDVKSSTVTSGTPKLLGSGDVAGQAADKGYARKTVRSLPAAIHLFNSGAEREGGT